MRVILLSGKHAGSIGRIIARDGLHYIVKLPHMSIGVFAFIGSVQFNLTGE